MAAALHHQVVRYAMPGQQHGTVILREYLAACARILAQIAAAAGTVSRAPLSLVAAVEMSK